MCRQDLSWQFLYLFGILDALELEYNDRMLVGTLVYTHIGVLDNAENEPAVFFDQHPARILFSWPTSSSHILHLHASAQPACALAARVGMRMRARASPRGTLTDAR